MKWFNTWTDFLLNYSVTKCHEKIRAKVFDGIIEVK